MKIVKIEYWRERFELKEPYSIAYNDYTHADNVFIKIITNNEIVGYGCAGPDYDVTKENTQTVLSACKEFIEPCIIGLDPLRISNILHKLEKVLTVHPSARAMLDMALYDILGKYSNLPVYKLLGGYRKSIKTSITIGILPVKETLVKAKEYVDKGFHILKLKGGGSLEEDIEKVLRLREIVGDKITIRFDANQGYSLDSTLEFIKSTKNAGLEILEQPIPRGFPSMLGKITDDSIIPIMADESLLNLRDIFRLTKKGLVDMVNVKLMKVGGIYEALQISAVARAGKLGIMVGCMDESALSIAAGLHYALSQPNVQYADLDGHFDLIGDPAADAVILKNGILHTNEKPGLGISLD